MVVIGAGVGLTLVEAAVRRNLTCALIEQSKFGGTCLTRGCIPSKMLVYPADVIREAARAKKIGLEYKPAKVSWARIAQRMWQEIGQSTQIENSLKSIDGLDVYNGQAEFAGQKTLRVRYNDGSYSDEFTGDKIIIAAGARSFIPSIEGLNDTGFVTSESFFGEKFPKKPWKSLLIIGGGAIGAEFAHIFSALGTKVTIAELGSRLLAAEEEEISAFIMNHFKNNGIRVLTNAKMIKARKAGRRKSATFEDTDKGGRYKIEAEEIFVCAGREPNSDSLKIDSAGIQTDQRGWIITDQYLKTSHENVWALGDINGKYLFRHKANFEAEVLVNNLFDEGDQRAVDYSHVPWAIYTWPQVAHAGMTEQEALRSGRRIMVGTNHYSKIAGGIAMGYSDQDQDNGFFKLIVDEEAKIIGAHIVGHNAAVLLQPFVYLMNARQKCDIRKIEQHAKEDTYSSKFESIRKMCPESGTYWPIFRSMVIHPSLSELSAWVIGKLRWSG